MSRISLAGDLPLRVSFGFRRQTPEGHTELSALQDTRVERVKHIPKINLCAWQGVCSSPDQKFKLSDITVASADEQDWGTQSLLIMRCCSVNLIFI